MLHLKPENDQVEIPWPKREITSVTSHWLANSRSYFSSLRNGMEWSDNVRLENLEQIFGVLWIPLSNHVWSLVIIYFTKHKTRHIKYSNLYNGKIDRVEFFDLIGLRYCLFIALFHSIEILVNASLDVQCNLV